MRHKPALVLLAILCALGVLRAGPVRADGPVSLDAYRRTVADTLALVDQAIAEKNFDARAVLLDRAAAMLEGVHEVQSDAGEVLPVNNEPLVVQMRTQAVAGTANPAKLLALRPRLQALLAALGVPPSNTSAEDDARLRDLLSKPPFSPDAQPPNELERLIDEWLSRLFGATIARPSGSFISRRCSGWTSTASCATTAR